LTSQEFLSIYCYTWRCTSCCKTCSL